MLNLIEESVSNMVFTLNTPWNFSEITLSMDALSVLIEINGTSSLGVIGKKLDMTIPKLEKTVNDLGRFKLIKSAEPRNHPTERTAERPDEESRPEPRLDIRKTGRNKQASKLLFRSITY
jgi:hypothetical protein